MTESRTAALFNEFIARHHAGESPELLDYLERAGDDAELLADMVEGALTEADAAPVGARTRREIRHALLEADAEEAEDRRLWAPGEAGAQRVSVEASDSKLGDRIERTRGRLVRWAALASAAGPPLLKAKRTRWFAPLSTRTRATRRARLLELLQRIRDLK